MELMIVPGGQIAQKKSTDWGDLIKQKKINSNLASKSKI